MAVKVRDKVTTQGSRFQEAMKVLQDFQVKIGFQRGEATEKDGTDICDIAAWNELGTENIPSRPFLRNSVDNHIKEIGNFLEDMLVKILEGATAEYVLEQTGLFQKDLIQKEITEGSYTPNAPATYARKLKKGTNEGGSPKPLIDTGRMRQSVNYQIVERGKE